MNIKIGQKLVKQKEFAKALDFFLNLSNLKKNNSTINFYLGLIYSELNDYKKSIKWIMTDARLKAPTTKANKIT